MFKQLGQIASLMKQAQEMQGRMQEMKEKLGRLKVEGSAGGGMVTVEMNGHQQLLGCRIDQSLFDPSDREMLDRELIEDLVVAAVNQALDRARQASADEMGKLAGGLNVPGLEDALSQLRMGSGS
jgi:nucleoid-associated protein EbfC